MRKLRRRLGGERGQGLILAVLVISVVFVIGVITVDFGLWFSERRGAQKDADLSALAAAQELLVLADCPDGTVQDKANQRASDYAEANGVSDPANVLRPDLGDCAAWKECWADEGDTSNTIDSYPLDIKHPSRALFGSIFSMVAPQGLGAHARACVGSVVGLYNLMPIGVPIMNPDITNVRQLCWGPDDDDPDDLPEPLFGIRCDLTLKDATSGEWGWLDLDNPTPPAPPSLDCSVSGGGANELGNEIKQGGANTYCHTAPLGFPQSGCTDAMNWCVGSKTGAQPQKVMDAFNTLFSTEGACDTVGGDGIDDFHGTFELLSGTEGTDSAFYEKICDSPRLVLLIIIDSYDPQGNPLYPIRSFASFFVEACRVNGVEYPKCDPPGGSIGSLELVGRFVNLVGEGAAGWPSDWAPKRTVLDE